MKKICLFLTFLAIITILVSASFSQTQDASKILALSAESVVTLVIYGPDKIETAKSSGLAIGSNIIITAYHPIASAGDVEAVTVKGKKLKIDGVLGVDRAHNLALLQVKGKLQPLVPGSFDALKEGDHIFAVGSNEEGTIIVSEGTLSGFHQLEPNVKILEFSLAVPLQFRGGPVLNPAGQVVGVIMTFERSVKFGLPVSLVQAVVKLPKPTAFKDWPRENYLETFEGASFAGKAAILLNESSTARTFLEKAVKVNPAFAQGHMFLANIYFKLRDFSAAEAAFRKVTELEANNSQAFYGLGLTLNSMMKHQEAAAALEQAIVLGIKSKEIYFELGGVYENLKDWARAADAYERFINLKPEVTWVGFFRLGLCRIELKQYDRAIIAFKEAEVAKPDDLKVKIMMADAYEKSGQLEQAEEIYYKMASLNPKEAKSYFMQAVRMYDAAGQYDKAVVPVSKIIELEPQNHENYFNLGLMYFKFQKFSEAIDAFKKSLAVKPDNAYAWFQVGSAYFQQSKYKEAIEAYKKYVELSPEDPSGWLSIGVSYMYIKNYESALEPLKKCLELKSDNASAIYNLAVCYLNLHDNFSARELYRKLQSLDPALAQKLSKFLK